MTLGLAMGSKRLSLFSAGMFFFVLVSPSLACNGQTEIYSDDFRSRDAGWFIQEADLRSGRVTIGDGRVLLKEDGLKGYGTLNLAFGLPTDADICVKVRIVQSADMAKANAGILFWSKGFEDNYLFQITGDGKYFVSHFSNRTWETITPAATASTFVPTLGADNLLRVLTKGQTVTLFINDTEMAKFRAPPPVGPVKAGFRGASTGNEPVAIEFRDFQVTVPK
jgi:hypothetical protein